MNSRLKLDDFPSISPVRDHIARPLWSVMIPTYNCARYLQQTLESVLAQDPGPDQMQIEVIDNCSTLDDPEAVVKEYGRGRVKFNRNATNIGISANWNLCLERSNGRLIHILHGDDWVTDKFYRRVNDVFLDSEVSVCITRAFYADEDGEISHLSPRLPNKSDEVNIELFYYKNPICCSGVVVRRDVYEHIGGFNVKLCYAVDWEMWIRAMLYSNTTFLNEPLAYYRFSSTNDSSSLVKTGKNLIDLLEFGKIVGSYCLNYNYRTITLDVINRAASQANHFSINGNNESYRANIEIYKQLFSQQPPKWRVKQNLKKLRTSVDRVCVKFFNIL